MAETITETGTLYSPTVGLVYVFNLIVGTGALTMPKAFASAGWLLSLILVVALAFMSYLTATFVIEVMASANAMLRWKKYQAAAQRDGLQNPQLDDSEETEGATGEGRPLLAPVNVTDIHRVLAANDDRLFDITQRVEMGQMASMFFNKIGTNVFYACIAIYLYGDLAIYAAAVPKSMRDVACTYIKRDANGSRQCNYTLQESDPCWEDASVTRLNAYRLFLAVFSLTLGPFVFFNVQKTKYLQIFTTLMRWLAFGSMIGLAVVHLAQGRGEGRPQPVHWDGVPTLFGVCVYSFMCHHSLPSLATPIKNKSKLFSLFAADYGLIMCFYALLSFTAIFCFKNIDDLYTLNFQPNFCDDQNPITRVVFIEYFLALFPVFTLSTNFPIIGITLRNNIKTLFYREGRPYSWSVDKLVFPLVTLLPPVAIAFITHNLESLVGITGSYAGAGIQYFVPIALAFYSRRAVVGVLGIEAVNKHSSPFRHNLWLLFVLIWGSIAIIFVTANHIITRK